MKIGMLGLALLFAMPHSGMAQTTDPAMRELIEKLLGRIESLEKRIAQLEQGGTGARPPATSTAPATAIAPGHAHDQARVPPAAAEAAEPGYPLLKLSGFSDLNFSATNLRGGS